jgi:adenylosuccinate lyase
MNGDTMTDEKDKLDIIGTLDPEKRKELEFRQKMFSPLDAKYGEKASPLSEYLSPEAEWKACAVMQLSLLQTRMEFGQAKMEHVQEMQDALKKISPLNMSLIEEKVTKHDQLAVLEEIGRYVSPETKALLHPGTTSYDILDSVRPYLFKLAYNQHIRPTISKSIETLVALSERSRDILQVGRTHLQDTSPVPFSQTLSIVGARLAERLERLDEYYDDLRGKVSGIVGTGASIEMVIGKGKAIEFEKAVLQKLDLKPDYTATQVTQKERMADVGHGLTTIMEVLYDFTEDIRKLYSSAIQEVTSRDNAERLGGSSADASKNNPIDYENIGGTEVLVLMGMNVLYKMIQTDFQRDLKNSKMARYFPQQMMAEVYLAFKNFNKALGQLSINEDRMAKNLQPIRNNPSEALVAILRGEKWVHSEYGVGHDFAKEMAKRAKREQKNLMAVALEDPEFKQLYGTLSWEKMMILDGKLEEYTGCSDERTSINNEYALSIARKTRTKHTLA